MSVKKYKTHDTVVLKLVIKNMIVVGNSENK